MIKISNYHTHTYLCNHACGKPVDYALQAQKDGCLVLGFSEHCPFPQKLQDHWPDIRLSLNDVKNYLEQIEEAKQAVDFKILTGYECEWDPAIDEWYFELRQGHKAQYLVLGQHWLTTNSGRHIYCGDFSSDQIKNLKAYTNQTLNAMSSGHFDFLAHPDVFMTNWIEWDQNSKEALTDILKEANILKLPIEINGYGIVKTPNKTSKGIRFLYPYDEFWEMVTDFNVPVICNSDAHSPDVVIKNALKAREYANRFNLSPIETLSLKKL